MPNIDFTKIKDPDKVMLNESQNHLLKKYLLSRKNFPEKASKENIDQVLEALNKLYSSFDKEQKKSFDPWFNYQLTFIAPRMLPCLIISKFASEYNLQKNLLISKNGNSISIKIDLNKLNKEIQTKIIAQYNKKIKTRPIKNQKSQGIGIV